MKKLFIVLMLFIFISSSQAMIFLGEFKAGNTVKYRVNFHNDTGTIENPTSPEAQLEKPDNSFTALTAPAQINSKTGHYGGSIDTTGFTAGQYLIRVAGTVATAKTTATELGFSIVTNITSDVMGEMTSPSYGLSKINTDMAKASTALTNATWTDTKAGYIDAAITSRSTYAGGAVASVTSPVTVGSNSDKTGYSGTCTNMISEPPSASTIRTEMDNNSTKLAHLNADITSRLGTADYTAPPTTANIWAYSSRTLTSVPISLPVMQGSVYTATAAQSREVTIVRGDTPRITFDLGTSYTGWTAKFAAKAKPDDTTYVIAVKDAVWTSAANGEGYIDLTAAETAITQKLYAELELRNGDSRLTGIKFILKIIEDVIK